ncbi:hypothetical protein THERMOT_226 [Bathymodiolus thermophilus thioautotrophic gill symbiont]|uniref:Uncharacterized protein n=1 Tax=Bathymodiolus thermophilus thioautotrophic gill symbiont TaxID=2360 RepID=A0A1J5TW05_9GAMM|nr:hypothetical protein MS2017_2171 [Bathymodiolus thermophilus thioautotrophic gill symbiont]OIR25016.1 hypothetical protein BGC33_05250 [Bathymodiolus thermophilus thioautotrophic gill symbiont]CAB5495022.1 hypothetical protein THERMOT_226 [Bathymodiolus thermophilus thioautotrophic gill symbiont]CAB5495260.1 hypothetical protein THERMOS_266 [Bathymodiolus thermophilus thioautotrophic gill symbiont]
MTAEQLIFAIISWVVLTSIVYTLTGWKRVLDCYKMWFRKEYWTNYNIIEAVSWSMKAIIIVPGLIFGVQLWQLYFVALLTSMSLIWASNRKLLPTLVSFNTLWIWLSMMIISQHII